MNYGKHQWTGTGGKQFLWTCLIIGIIVVGVIALINIIRPDSYYKQTNTGTYRCIKTYTILINENSTSKRVDMMPVNGGTVVTFICDDDLWLGQTNSATLYAQFEPAKWYQVTTVGYRREGMWPVFPIVTQVYLVPEPKTK